MGDLEGLQIKFKESMSGWLGKDQTDFKEGAARGRENETPIKIKTKIKTADLAHFLNVSDHSARLTGTVSYGPLGGKFDIRDGIFNLFSVDPFTGRRRMIYAFRFTANDDQTYFFHGFKDIKDDEGFDLIEDMTTLFTRIYAGPDETAPIYAAGILTFKLTDSLKLMSSMSVTGTDNPWRKLQAQTAFFSFIYGSVRNVYLRKINPFYDTSYQNLVLSGEVDSDNDGRTEFFLVSGFHDHDFPWGDGEIFSDILLVIGDKNRGYKKYCLTARILEGLKLDVKRGRYRYQGPLYELTDHYATSFTQMNNPTEGLLERRADIEIEFEARPYNTTPLPFQTADNMLADLATALKNVLENILPSIHLLGIFITPHTVTVKQGRIKVTGDAAEHTYTIEPSSTFGEAERSTLKNIKEPTMLYGYICALCPEARTARVQIHSNSMRNEPEYWVKDQLDALLGSFISHTASKEMLMENNTILVRDIGPEARSALGGPTCFQKLGRPLLEVNNDHFPTAVFQRRIIEVLDPSGETCLALEEDMEPLRLEAVNSGRVATVAAIKNDDKFTALEEVLNRTGFWDRLKNKYDRAANKDDFSIVVKPNFMFAYNKHDHSTYTDPKLVEHLVGLLRDRGDYQKVVVAEAQSTYGEYFTKRSVREVAEYLGYDLTENKGYKVVDLTLDSSEQEHLGAHLGRHPVPLTWKNADFRISFAKNKTHAYAYYTLTLKNIYGALSLANKFKEYHCDRDIYHTTIEYLKAYPVDFGLIDAYLSADGPFGIFADSDPNTTQTIIGGDDLVAVDWVGASKMGLDPTISQYMRLAVQALGKPRINFIGDSNPYKPWLNVPMVLTLFTHYGLDASHYFGNLIYMSAAYMDESHFEVKDRDFFIQAARAALDPIKKAVFLLPEGERTVANRLLGRFLTWLGR